MVFNNRYKLENEIRTLDCSIRILYDFTHSREFDLEDTIMQTILKNQLEAMKDVSMCLHARLSYLSGTK